MTDSEDAQLTPATEYPAGIALIRAGKCPKGGLTPMACMFCMCGHMLECHYPDDCETAQCSHLSRYEPC